MTNIIEEAAVRVLPDFTGFRASLDRQLRTVSAGAAAKIRIEADTSAPAIRTLQNSIQRAVKQASAGQNANVKIKAELDDRALKAQLQRIEQQTITVKVRYETEGPNPLRNGGGGGGGTRRSGSRPSGEGAAEDASRFASTVGNAVGGIASAIPGVSGSVGKSISSAITAAGPEAAAAVIGVGALVVGALSTVILTGVGSIAAAIGGGGILAAGIVLALKDPAIKAAASNEANKIGAVFTSAAKPLGPALVGALHTVGTTIQRLSPQIDKAFGGFAPTLSNLGTAVAGLFQNASPGITKLVGVAKDVLDAIIKNIPGIGTSINNFANSIAGGKDGLTAFITDFIDFTERTLEFTGKIIEVASKIYGFFSKLRAEFRSLPTAIRALIDPIGTLMDVITGGSPKQKAANAAKAAQQAATQTNTENAKGSFDLNAGNDQRLQAYRTSGLATQARLGGLDPNTTQAAFLAGPVSLQNNLDEAQKKNVADLAEIKRLQDRNRPYSIGDAQNGTPYNPLTDAEKHRLDVLQQQQPALQNYINQGNQVVASETKQATTVNNTSTAYDTLKNSVDASNQAFTASLAGLAQTTTLLQQVQAASAQNAINTPEKRAAQVVDYVTQQQQQYAAAMRNAASAGRAYKQSQEAVGETETQNALNLKNATQEVTDTHRAYIQSLDAVKQAQQRVQDSTVNLANAREQARRQLRDSANTELSAKLQQEQANQQYALVQGLDPNSMEYQQALLAKREADNNASDTTADNAKLKKEGVEGNPAVVQARRDKIQSEKDYKTSLDDSKRSLEKYHDAQANVNKVINDNKKALDNAKQARADQLQNWKDQKTAADNLKKSLDPLNGTFLAQIKADGSDAQAKVKTVLTYVQALDLEVQHPDWDSAQVWAQATKNIGAYGAPVTKSKDGPERLVNGHRIGGAATGGPVWGRGTDTSDDIPYMLSKNEHIITAQEVAGAGGHAAIERQRMQWRGAAAGGPVLDRNPTGTLKLSGKLADTLLGNLSKLPILSGGTDTGGVTDTDPGAGGNINTPTSGKLGSALASIKTWLQQTVDPLPYILGSVGPRAYDCSGLVGEVWARLTGHPSYQRYFVTANEKSFLEKQGFKKGTGTFTVGFNDHHTVGRIDGLNFAAANSRAGIYMNKDKPENYPNVYYLPGVGSGTGAGGGRASNPFAGLPAGLRPDQLKNYFLGGGGGNASLDGGNKGAEESYALSRFAKYGWSANQLSSLKTLWDHESGWNPLAANSIGAYGIPQALPGSKMASAGKDWRTNYKTQINWGEDYIKNRYGTPDSAWAVWTKHAGGPGLPNKAQGWYDKGGYLTDDVTTVVRNTKKPEYVMDPTQTEMLNRMLSGGGLGTTAEKREFAMMIAQALQQQQLTANLNGHEVAKFSRKSVAEFLTLD